ncbi:hypothetical protein MY5147_007905 [Beauveria neobassiana]|uniref:Imidazoleglycerol-phosphate dehydratase n=5 Tax=Beauveria TaxID=5581 RepID=J5K3L5_BEAB2|nr:uncharacterized protein BBA_02658 [Beauveria bassiana ARSEF 2860]EJP68656.1 hypothetical protein BBA_02658 [Beauveria bassiana ARSEF 2860]OAA41919.1 hypothetical protein BBO_05278 [Beauveria brongniartii RCEF 3172]PQK14874.1 hypothetical protein BB8028_0005g03960 [Beauveria bassiana]
MPSYSPLKTEEANAASWESAKGAGIGAAKWGAGAAVLAAVGHFWSPIYRGTTVQFKVFVQMSAMVLGGMIEADHRLRLYEYQMRMQRRVQREQAKWERYQDEFIQANSSKK